MENYLYLLEVFIETITFSSNISEIPKLSDIVISADLGRFTKVDIFSMHHDPDSTEKQTPLVVVNSGKSSLFSCSPDELLRKCNQHPLHISVSVKRQPIAETNVDWEKKFLDLITTSAQFFGVSGPVGNQDKYILKEPGTGKLMGDINIQIKLSSYGTNIQTSYQLIYPDKDMKKKYLIRGARGDTTFECQKFGPGSSSELMPVSPLFTPSAQKESAPALQFSPTSSFRGEDPVSWMALFKSPIDATSSNLPSEFGIAITNMFSRTATASNTTFDIVSIIERPEENKFMDLRIRNGSHGLIFELEPVEHVLSHSDSLKKSVSVEIDATPDMLDEDAELTIDKIEKALCTSKDCPAAKKFKEFGIGPLATVKGLGTLRNDVTPPVTYGISQTYGVFDEYGPYGLFLRPKRPEDPFIPGNKNNDWAETCWKPKLRRKDQKLKEEKCCKDHPPLRLTGGGVFDYDDVKSPLHECKEIMDQFDQVLAQYKEALGPCGKVTCPYAPNISKETCMKKCHVSGGKEKPVETKQYIIKAPPPKEDSKLPKGACGSAKCPYAKYKSGLVESDLMMELQYLPPAPSGKCGHPKCPSPVEPELPPIHWDCPDPLPKGRCKNPACPYLPKELRCLNAVMKKGPCGNLSCPYSPPDPCKSPTCPFSAKKCPYQQEQNETNSLCENPECPYSEKGNRNDLCDNPECPYAPQNNGCGSPTCPQPPPCGFMPPCGAPPCGGMPPCGAPFCGGMPPCSPLANPYLQALLACYMQAVAPDLLKICFGGPECPYTKKKSGDKKETGEQKSKEPVVCQEEVCGKGKKPDPAIPEFDRTCNNPTCPYVPKPSEDVCGNPNCPFGNNKKKKKSGNGGEGELQEGDTEYVVEEREEVDYTPCRPGTCKAQGGDLVCDECGACPCNQSKGTKRPCEDDGQLQQGNLQCDECGGTARSYEPQDEGKSVCYMQPPPCGMPLPCSYMVNPLQALLAYCLPFTVCNDVNCPYTAKEIQQIMQAWCGAIGEGQQQTGHSKPPEGGENLATGETEYVTDTRTDFDNAPCTQQTCKSTGGDLECSECPCGGRSGGGGGGGDGELKEGDTEYKVEERTSLDMAPCRPETCMGTGGKLKCDVCPCGDGEPKEGDTEYKVEKRTSLDMAPCRPETCMATGGKLKCDVCPCGGGAGTARTKTGGLKFKRKKGKGKGKYVYSVGDKYPGVQIGHKECVIPSPNVPRTMGWLWNVFTPCLQLKPRRGWRPGAIARTIAATIRKHREKQGIKMLEIKDLAGRRGYYDGYESAASVHVTPKPTLQIKKKDGCYWITMNPLKDPHTLVENENPYMDCTPMQFKIVKNKDKKEEVINEYKSCFCGDDEPVVVSSSSDSELDIEFTPPAGIIHPERFKKKRNVVHGGTQYLPADFETKSAKSSKKGKGKGKDKKGKGKKGGKGQKGKKK